MNNRSLYMICAFVALVLLILERREIRFVDIIGHVVVCGGAIYYVVHQYKLKKSVTLLMALMAALGIVYNPIYLPHLPNVGWVIAHVVAMVLFYLVSLRTPIGEAIGKHLTEK
ncbi:DUF6804 family protein [Porphyromonas levii]|uniref:DUF6804 family protein n=1 Tax=Porphyromonas levii TaxID=28114 RepID=UPI001B8AF726|nr:DUF6804 family protein [Porphyromonas levii]